MGKKEFDSHIEAVFWDGAEDGKKHPVEWRRTWARGTGQPVGFDTQVKVGNRAPRAAFVCVSFEE